MQIKDLMRLLSCKRYKALEKVNVCVGYLLFRATLCKKDDIPTVGTLRISEDKTEAVIKLDKKWVRLLKGEGFEEEMLEYLKGIVNRQL